MAHKKMTIETLAEISQQEFFAIKQEMATKDDVQAVGKAILHAIDVVRLDERVETIEQKLGIKT